MYVYVASAKGRSDARVGLFSVIEKQPHVFLLARYMVGLCFTHLHEAVAARCLCVLCFRVCASILRVQELSVLVMLIASAHVFHGHIVKSTAYGGNCKVKR